MRTNRRVLFILVHQTSNRRCFFSPQFSKFLLSTSVYLLARYRYRCLLPLLLRSFPVRRAAPRQPPPEQCERSFLLLKSKVGVEIQSAERQRKCCESSSAATLAAMLNTYYKTVFERSFVRLWTQADGTGESMMIFWGEPIQTNFGCSEAHRQSPLLFGRGQPLSFTLSFGETPWFDEEGEIRRCDWSENVFLCMCLV